MGVQLELRKLRVRSLDIDFHEISWELEQKTAAAIDVLDHTFTVLRSEGPEGPYDAISPAMDDQFVFIDNNVPIGSIYRALFYKILVTEKATGDTKEFGPVSRDPEPDLIALEIRKHINLVMREFAGRRCWVLPIRTFGQRCECYDPVLQKQSRSRCRTCFDTGFVRGYFSPVEAFISIDPSSKQTQQTNLGELEQKNTTARMGYWPPLKPNDIIVEGENARWRVVQVSQSEHSRASVLQEVQIHHIMQKDIEYTVPINLGDVKLRDLFITPSRNFTNPHTLENFMDEELPQIFELYTGTHPKVPA